MNRKLYSNFNMIFHIINFLKNFPEIYLEKGNSFRTRNFNILKTKYLLQIRKIKHKLIMYLYINYHILYKR